VLQYREIAPHPRLASAVACLWTLRGSDAPRSERILPDGSFELIVHLGEPFTQAGLPQPRAMVMGQIRRAVVVTPSSRADVIGVRFRLGAAGAFFPIPMRELRDLVVPLDDVLPGASQRLFDAGDHIAAVQSMLLARFRKPDRLVARAVELIRRARGDVRVRALAAAIGTSERTLERAFDAHAGMGPKTLARIVRLQASVRGEDAGYYDDAHRIHEFREIAGVTPSQFFGERNAVNAAIVGNLQDAPAAAR
jgi:AraC-like DNA-binding protein